jgi:hypothetical protein
VLIFCFTVSTLRLSWETRALEASSFPSRTSSRWLISRRCVSVVARLLATPSRVASSFLSIASIRFASAAWLVSRLSSADWLVL